MALVQNVRPQGALLSDTEKNPKECKVVTLRNGRELEERRWTKFETVVLTEECSSRVRNKIPPKLKDSGIFTISITIGNIEVGLAFCDLGASITLMPTFMFRTLGLGEPRPTTVTLQLADRSLEYPDSIIEDVLVKVGPFILPIDFIILDYKADKNVLLIMGKGFLATVNAVIRVRDGKMSMTVDEKKLLLMFSRLLSFRPIMKN
ncbi:uncharacterized protein LOC132631102 [Lycium barbarum]|uniref:uncharacterized protein LOC132631102 n=1 Tax=Lycium barbarum TaxID=112863 RepID=UPI00293E87A0|nr:uncharacterized protein LOC132631102 [Lycium barbarum]